MNEGKRTYKTDVMDKDWTEEEARERVERKEAENKNAFWKFGIYILVFFVAMGIVIYKFNS